jgi:hypothetical protein
MARNDNRADARFLRVEINGNASCLSPYFDPQRFTAIINDCVRRYPGQWLWVHRRRGLQGEGAVLGRLRVTLFNFREVLPLLFWLFPQ